MRIKTLLSATVLAILFSCRSEPGMPVEFDRPYHPWVVRSVLDGMPRMITLALHDDLWVAYHTGRCGIVKAWKGHVRFDGPVFTTAHGPQPTTIGDGWLEDTTTMPWEIVRGEEALTARAVYAGHRIRYGHAELMYRIDTRGIGPIRIFEQVEYLEGPGGQTGLERIFSLEDAPAGTRVRLRTAVNSVASRRSLETNGQLEILKEMRHTTGNLEVLAMEVALTLLEDNPTRLVTWFAGRPAIPNPNASGLTEDVSLPLGQRLIERSDCKTCHNPRVRTIGPSYAEVAERYPTNNASVAMLVNKVIAGGTGIWGSQVMSPHPNLSPTDASEIIRYILSLDADEGSSDASPAERAEYLAPAGGVDLTRLIPGAITTIFTYDHPLDRIPRMSGQPRMGGVMPNFDNINDGEFIDLAENFAIHSSGFLHIPERGEYIFQLWSDDGSRLSINGAVLIDHDGPHSTSAKEKIVGLEEGYYAFELDFYQGAGGRFLSLDWKRPGGTEYEVIPAALFYHTPEQRMVTSGLTLPMSAIARFPGDKFPLEAMHPAYDLFQARPDDFLPKVGGMDFLSDSTLVISTWDAAGSVFLLRNVYAEEPGDIRVKQIATGLAEPLGLKVVDDQIYVLQKQELTELIDTDGDEIIDEYRAISNQWQTSGNFHEFAFGLEYREGYFYANLATAIDPGGASTQPQVSDRGKVMKISAADGSVEFIAHGLRTPNGIGWGVDGELFVSDNQGDWLPSSKILHVTPGDWFGSRSVDFAGTEGLTMKPPVVWLPQDEIGNSPSTPGLLKDGPYAGQMMHGEVTHGGIKRVFVEKVGGAYQGAVFRFIQGLEAGVNRIVYGPDGSLFAGGVGNPGNWGQAEKLWYGLQRLRYNSKPVFEMLAVRAKTDGIEIEFTEPLREGDGWNVGDFQVGQWRYVPTENYGGPKVDETGLRVISSHVSADRKRVFLALEGMKAGHVVYVHLRRMFVSAPGNQLWSTEAWYTMNRIPDAMPGDRTIQQSPYSPNTLTEEEKALGWKLLFDGKTLNGWRNYNKSTIGSDWVVRDGAICLDAKRGADGRWNAPDGGEILTDGEYENFEFAIDWKVSTCGNSGIIYNVTEMEEYVNAYQTGPEMQILDNSCHPDSRFLTHQAGDLYDMIACTYVTVKPAGEWNSVRIIKNNGHVEHWLNGVKVVEFEMYTDRWREMIANSKFRDWKDFGIARKGKIALQDHDDPVSFRNIKIREL